MGTNSAAGTNRSESEALLLAELGETLGIFSRRYYEWLTTRLRGQGVNPGKRRILRLLVDHGPMKMSSLALELQLDPKRMTKMVDDLEALNLVMRVPEPEDRRAKLVQLTEVGIATWPLISETFAASVSELVGGMSAEEMQRLREVIGHFIARMTVLGPSETLDGSL